ncbi:FadD7 family fatty acid--CoA ligase [Streptomyces sp. NPDC059569]|uniref:FadD7 family fatty acid--CoA ligase n=1 Tax=Streptomyces sp. NPDC059569 TaxID=3346869 RepID=UPI0036770A3A
MSEPTTASVSGAGPYRPPEFTGLADLLDEQLRERPGAPALVVGEDRIPLTYRALDGLIERVAGRLGSEGLRRGDAVALTGANTVEFVVALFAAARAGLVVAPLDPALPEPQMSARLRALGARAVVVGAPALEAVPAAWGAVPGWILRIGTPRAGRVNATLDTRGHALETDTRGRTPDAGNRTPDSAPSHGTPSRGAPGAAPRLSAEDALVLFTAGTTDRAKMVPLTHANVAASVRGICAGYELGPADATVAVMPLFHGHGLLAALLAPLAAGGCVLLPAQGRFSAHTFWDDVRAAGATWFTAVPTIHEILLERAPREYPGPRVAPLRFVRSCSAPLSAATGRALERTLGVPVLSAYGMTESTHQATSQRLPGRGAPGSGSGAPESGSVGRTTGVDLRIVGPDGKDRPPGAVGEVWVRGPTVTRGYLGDPAETARGFTDGWFHTGDLGSLDRDGELVLTGRIKDLINRGGEKISPEHVEDVLSGGPGVAEAAVYPVPDATYGQRVGAAVVTRDGAAPDADRILAYCRARLAPYEVPDRLEITRALPHTVKGALDRKAVAEQYAH